jgi:esterase
VTDPILSHDRITADGAEPMHWLYVLHGIFGAGRNWASVIRRVVRARPEWGALLVDLRQHGASQGFEPPHDIRRAADDLDALAVHTGHPPAAILGHSFGGKVAMLYAAAGLDSTAGLRQLWIIDSTPATGPTGGSAWAMLQVVRSLPGRFGSRDELVDALVAQDVARPTAQWMATNLEADDDGYRWRFDLDAIHALLESFYQADAWDIVENPPEGVEVHLVRAEESSVLSGDALDRATRAVDAAGSRTFLHPVAGGHWVNADNPAAIEKLLVQMLPS